LYNIYGETLDIPKAVRETLLRKNV